MRLLSTLGADVFALDINPPAEKLPENSKFFKCDQTSWDELNAAFAFAGGVDIAVANAGVSEEEDFATDIWESDGKLKQPNWKVVDVNFCGTIAFVKLASAWMRKQGRKRGGSIVITSSATAYVPEQSLPVYSGTKHALAGFMRAQRSTLPLDNISINTVAPTATVTALLPQNLATPMMAANLPVSVPEDVALAIVFSATASQGQAVEEYGKDKAGSGKGKWNGRSILTLAGTYTELETGIANTKPEWFGRDNLRLTRMQQTATDFRNI